jgi:serine/threonine protein kinase
MSIACQIADEMNFIHSSSIVHRDLKSMNVLLDATDSVQIADFGLAGYVKDNSTLFGLVGTPQYTASEILQ